MLLFHGSPSYFDYPSLNCAKGRHDFGLGFYLAEYENDAVTMCYKNGGCGFLYSYSVEPQDIYHSLNTLILDEFNEEWAQYLYNNRIEGVSDNYDVVIGMMAGGHANDLFKWIRKEQIPFEECCDDIIKECSNTSFGEQWCLKSEKALEFIELVSCEDMNYQ